MFNNLDHQDIIELKQRINRLEAQVKQLYMKTGLTFQEDPGPGDDPAVIAALRVRDIPKAIMHYRQSHPVGLAEAKAAVEDLQKRLGL